jgi:hypothetical protein
VQLKGRAILEANRAIEHHHQIVERRPANECTAPAPHLDDPKPDQ